MTKIHNMEQQQVQERQIAQSQQKNYGLQI